MGDMVDDAEIQSIQALAEWESLVDTPFNERKWIDRKKKSTLICSMSNRWLKNIKRYFDGYERTDYCIRTLMLEWVDEEIQRRKNQDLAYLMDK